MGDANARKSNSKTRRATASSISLDGNKLGELGTFSGRGSHVFKYSDSRAELHTRLRPHPAPLLGNNIAYSVRIVPTL